MAKIVVSADCGNSPRKIFLKDFLIAFAEGDADFIIENADDDITWTIVGNEVIRGKADFEKAVRKLVSHKTEEMVISTIVTHGKDAAANGETKLENGKTQSFCHIYTFRGAKGNILQSITSYVIDMK